MTENNYETVNQENAERDEGIRDYLRSQIFRRWAQGDDGERREIEVALKMSPAQAHEAAVALIAPPRVRGQEQETAL